MGGCFGSVDLEMGVCAGLQEVSAHGRLKMCSFRREIAGTQVLCLLMRGVHLQEVSVSGGSTV